MIRRAPWVLTVLLALAAAPAAAEQVFDLGTQAPVPGNKTWRDLLGQFFPDLRQEPGEDGKLHDFIHGRVDLRPIDQDGFGGCDGSDPLEIEYIEAARADISKKERLIVGVTTDHDACYGALALFDGMNDGKLLDVANIQQDIHYGFGRDFVRRLGPDGQLVVADNFHLNSGQSFDHNLLVLVTADKLSWLGDVEADSEWDCDHHRRIAEDAYVTVTPDYGAFDRITGYVKRTVQRVTEDCRTLRGDPTVAITRTDWRWDATRKAYRKANP